MKILLVEDDAVQISIIENELLQEFNSRPEGCFVDKLATEHDFRKDFERIAREGYDLFVIDMMLRWCDVAERMPDRPTDCEDFSRAGVRCCQLLKADSRTIAIPVFVLTVLENRENGLGLPEGCEHVQKTSEFARVVSEMLSQPKPWPQKP